MAALIGASLGWNEWNFKLFYLSGAVLNVPFLALGTVYLLAGPHIGDDHSGLDPNQLQRSIGLFLLLAGGAIDIHRARQVLATYDIAQRAYHAQASTEATRGRPKIRW